MALLLVARVRPQPRATHREAAPTSGEVRWMRRTASGASRYASACPSDMYLRPPVRVAAFGAVG